MPPLVSAVSALSSSASRRQHLGGASEQWSFDATYSTQTDKPYDAAMAQKTLTMVRPSFARHARRITVPTAPMLSHHSNTFRRGASASDMESAKISPKSSYSKMPGGRARIRPGICVCAIVRIPSTNTTHPMRQAPDASE